LKYGILRGYKLVNAQTPVRNKQKINILNMKKIILGISCLVILTSCAVSRKVKYDNLKMNLSEIKTKNISLALLDQREAVVDGSRKPDFVGYMRSGVGIAWPIGTESKNNFMADLSSNIVNSLLRFDINANNIVTAYTENEYDVKSKLFTTKDDKKLLFVFDELHTDGYAIQLLHYKINVFIYDKNNELLKHEVYDAQRKLGGTVAWGAGSYKKYMPEAIVKLFEEILNDEEILKAINK